ncbi:hypothetical protein K2P97_04375 [bacterium]|nr:hypothetical protein [bacterium]
MKMNIFLMSLCIAFFACNTAYAQRIGHHDETWKTIHTEHFDVIVSAKQQDLGLYYAHAAERAYHVLSSVFSNRTEKIVLIVNDTTDEANGFATRIPYPHIMAYAVPVNEHESLSEAGDWARELLIHELTHIFQFEPATGFYSWLRPIFGTIIAPNMLTPLWWKEGMSVEMETQFSPRGRLRSTYQDATIRSLVLEKKLFDYSISEANEVLPSWPYGSRSYLFGSMFFSQLAYDTKNIKSISYLADRQGERVPYFIEEPMRELTNNSYEMQYMIALHATEQNAKKQIKQLNTQPLTAVQSVQQKNNSSIQPRYSPQFKLLAFIENQEGDTRLRIIDEAERNLDLKKLPTGEITDLDFHPTEKKIIYSKIERIDSNYILSDLHIYDIESDKSEQITHSQRARSVRFSEDGNQAVFVTTFSGQTQLRTIDLKTKAVKFIINSTMGVRYESPVFWDNKTLLASKIDANGIHRLVKIDLGNKVESYVALNFKQIRFLKKLNNSLYFVSSENGVNNIYRSSDLATAQPVTHLATGTWSYDMNSEGTAAWASLMTEAGFKVKKIELSQQQETLPVIENDIQKRYSFNEISDYSPKKFNTAEYEASSYLWPTYWIPFVSTNSSSKGVFLQAQTTGQDPIKKHQYSLAASYDSELNKGNFSGIYVNSTQKIPFKVSSTIQSRALGNYNDIVQTTTHSFSLLPDTFWINRHLTFEAGVQLQETYYTTRSQHLGPYFETMYKNFEQNIYQISPESGWGGLLRFEKLYKLSDDTNIIAKDYEKASFTLVGFASPWLPHHHVIKARASGMQTFSSVLGRYGASSSSTFFEQDGLTPQFVLRAYPSAQFFGRSMWNTNFEYRFPVSNIERGSGTDAYFFKRIIGAVIVDGLGVEGNALAENLSVQNLRLNESFWNSGIELKLESTIGYVLAMNFVLGYYIPHSPLFASSSQLGLSLQIGGF